MSESTPRYGPPRERPDLTWNVRNGEARVQIIEDQPGDTERSIEFPLTIEAALELWNALPMMLVALENDAHKRGVPLTFKPGAWKERQ